MRYPLGTGKPNSLTEERHNQLVERRLWCFLVKNFGSLPMTFGISFANACLSSIHMIGQLSTNEMYFKLLFQMLKTTVIAAFVLELFKKQPTILNFETDNS